MTARKTGLSRRNPAEFGTVEARGLRFRAFYRSRGAVVRAPKTFETRVAARAWLAEQERAILGGVWVDPRLAADTLASYCEDWLTMRTDLAPRTVEFYRGALDRWILPKLGSLPLSGITPAKVNAWRSECLREAAERSVQEVPAKVNPIRLWAKEHGVPLAEAGRIPANVRAAWEKAGAPSVAAERRQNAGTGASSVAAAYRSLKTILATAERDDIIAKNPCRLRNAASAPAKRRTPATPDQVTALAKAMPPQYSAAVTLAAWSGLRSGELRALTRGNVDLEAGTVRVERGIVEVAGKPLEFGPTKTAGSRRVVALPVFVVEVLREHMAEHVWSSPDALLFSTRDNKPLTRFWLGEMFRMAREVVGLPEIRWHDLRHTGASLAYSVGASVADVQKRLGHTTMRAAAVYAHAYENADVALAERLNAAFGKEAPL